MKKSIFISFSLFTLIFLSYSATAEQVLSVVSAPIQTIKRTPFSNPYVVSVQDGSGKALTGASITVSWPMARNRDIIIYDTENLKTDEKGTVSFTPPVPQFSFEDFINFYPTPAAEPPAIQAAAASGLSIPYNVKTDYNKKIGIMYVFAFDEQGKPQTNSAYILRDFINSGFKAGNAPFDSAEYLSVSPENLYQTAYTIVGNSDIFMVYGTISYAAPVEKLIDGRYSCTLTANVSCMDMRDGSIIFHTQQTESVIAETKAKAFDNCHQALANKTVHSIIYGM
jgi:hypothetical protein